MLKLRQLQKTVSIGKVAMAFKIGKGEDLSG